MLKATCPTVTKFLFPFSSHAMTAFSEQTVSSGHLYQVALDSASDACIVIDEQSHIVEWLPQAENVFGWSEQEALGKKLTDLIISEHHQAACLQGLKSGSADDALTVGKGMEFQARHKKGKEMPVRMSFTPVPANGNRAQDRAQMGDPSGPKERQQLEIALQRQAYLSRRIIDGMADAILVTNTSGQLVMANSAALELFDIQPPEVHIDQLTHTLTLFEEDRTTLIPFQAQPLTLALSGKTVHQKVAFLHHGRHAKEVCVTVNATPLLDEGGQALGAFAVFHDITEQQRQNKALSERAQHLHEQADLLNLTREAIIVRALPEDTITYWNRGAERLYKYRSEQALGRVSHDLLATRFPVPLQEILNTTQQQGYWEGELTNIAADGHTVIVHSQWVLDYKNGRAARFLETNTDVTQRVQAEQALRQSQQNYQLLVESSTEYAIILVSPDGLIQSWNRGAENILGYAPQEAVGAHFEMLFTMEDRTRGTPMRELEKARLNGRADSDRWHPRRDGSKFWAVGITSPSRNPDGSLHGFVKIMRDRTAQRMAEEQTHFLANHDALTGLPNRVRFSDELHQAIALCERNQSRFALLLLDLDRFKYVNDTFGHHAGDLLLKEVSLRIRSTLRETDFVARLGGDEFVVIQMEAGQPQAAQALAGKLVRQLGQPYLLEASEVTSGGSIGVAVYPDDASNSVELLKRADLALYRAKHAGRHNFQFYTSELAAELASREDRAQALRRALQNHQFELYYQPQIDLNNWSISTVEALLRWHASDLDLLAPRDFLSIAEETGVIVEIGVWALREACVQVKKWQMRGLSELRVSVNCSARQFRDPEFVAMVPRVLQEAGLRPSSLELEVPESLLSQRPEIKEQVAALRALGIRITIDNFGTGNTALRELQSLEVDALKIDKAFVRYLPHRREDSAIASAIISLARNLGIGVVAGGVETAEQLAYLKSRECQGAQGFIFSPPVTANKFEDLLSHGNWSQLNQLSGMNNMEAMNNLH